MGDIGLGQVLIALALGIAIWVVSLRVIRALSMPPPDVDPSDVVELDEEHDYRCTVCGTEVSLRVVNVTETSAPKHCREEMVAVWRPGRHLRADD